MKTGITLEVRGATYDVDLDEDKGVFWTVVGDQSYRSESVEKLRDKVVKATRQSNLNVKFARPNADGSVRYGTVTGIHATQRAVLVQWDDGKRESIQSYSAHDMLQPLSDEQAGQYSDLVQIAKRAMDQLQAFKTEHRFNAWLEATEAVKATAETETK